MTINNKYKATIIGGMFTIGSLILSFTYVVPIISLLPASYLELFVSIIVNNEPYSIVGVTALVLNILILIIFVVIVFMKSRKTSFDTSEVVKLMIIGYFIFHSLGFFIYWGTSLDFRSDGQLIFLAIKSFPISSFSLVLFGVLIDIVINKQRN